MRAKRVNEWGLDMAERFARGMVPSPELVFPLQEIDEHAVFLYNRPALGLLSGTLFTERSALWANAPDLTRAG